MLSPTVPNDLLNELIRAVFVERRGKHVVFTFGDGTIKALYAPVGKPISHGSVLVPIIPRPTLRQRVSQRSKRL